MHMLLRASVIGVSLAVAFTASGSFAAPYS